VHFQNHENLPSHIPQSGLHGLAPQYVPAELLIPKFAVGIPCHRLSESLVATAETIVEMVFHFRPNRRYGNFLYEQYPVAFQVGVMGDASLAMGH